jgi:sigma-B regulation protein RsbU (phosphoserine phosphatase)
MITAAAKSCCDTVRGMSGDHFSLLQLMSAMNFAIYQSARRSFVMTMFVALFDPVRKVISYVNAAHNFPYVVRAGGTMSCLAARGNRLGDRLDSEYGIREEAFGPGDLFVFYTDGLVECTSPDGEEFGEKRLRRLLMELAPRSVLEVRDEVVQRAMKFYGTEKRKDDITMVVARTKG